jgi:two-component system response regulator HydG
MKPNRRLLVIEDDLEIQELMKAFFMPRGFEILVYDDAETALADLKNNKVKPNVIVTDLMLPRLSGIDFTRQAHSLDLDVPIILVTSNKKLEVAVEAIHAGAYDFVLKPIQFPQLLISIERALHLSQIKFENTTLKSVVNMHESSSGFDGVIGKSPGFKQALDLAARVAKSKANVMITGESGTGKEVIARAIHRLGARSKAPFIAINCSAIPENLLESELFGHAKGSFTGASDRRTGLFEESDGGTLLLDEIGDLSMVLQAKILRVLQERKIKRIGENNSRSVDVRIISATHKDLRKEIAEKNFREDLFFRLNVIPIRIPPLRDRKEDIIPLAEFFLKKFAALSAKPPMRISKEAMSSLLSNPWRGNVRELENTIERAVVLCNSDTIQLEDITSLDAVCEVSSDEGQDYIFRGKNMSSIMTIDQLTKNYIQHVLIANNGVKEKTASDLGIDRKTLYRKLNEIQQSHPSV